MNNSLCDIEYQDILHNMENRTKCNNMPGATLVIDAQPQPSKIINFEGPGYGTLKSARQPSRQRLLTEIGKRRHLPQKPDSLVENHSNEMNKTALASRRLFNVDMSLRLGAGNVDSFVKFPSYIGSTERELLHLTTYRKYLPAVF
jgi:hypothetical protein